MVSAKQEQFQTNETIHSADLCGSLDAAQAPYFDSPLLRLPEIPFEKSFHSKGFDDLDKITTLDKTLRGCVYYLEQTMLFWSSADSSSLAAKLDQTSSNAPPSQKPTPADAARVRYLLTTIQYTLASTNFQDRPSDASFANQIFEFCRITLILYSLTVLNERPASTAVGQQVTSTFRTALTNLASRLHRSERYCDSVIIAPWLLPLPSDFILWAVFLAIIVLGPVDSNKKEWLLGFFDALTSSDGDGIQDWVELKTRLSRYLWVARIHDASSRWLWDLRMSMRQCG